MIIYLRDRGIGILITDHNVRETLGVTDRAYIMADGRVFRSGAPLELTEDPEVRRLYLGEKFRL
jgi:lipopolysaccharide export system ATP-binding protein